MEGMPAEDKEKTGQDEAEKAEMATETKEEGTGAQEAKRQAADRRSVVVHEGSLAFAELLRQSDVMSTLLTAQEETEEMLLAAAQMQHDG